jgi:hypothetical protein
MSRRQAGRIAGSAALLLAAVTACSSSGGGTSAAASPSEGASSQFASCLRSHGVNVPGSAGSDGSGGMRSALQNAPASARNAAMKACGQYLGSVTSGGGRLAQMSTYLKCLDSHGADVSTTAGPQLRTQLQDPNAQTQKAEQACSADKPSGTPAGGG